MKNRDEMRAEFENVVKACGYYGDLKYCEFGYERTHTNAMWAGFRLAYELKDAQLRLLMSITKGQKAKLKKMIEYHVKAQVKMS